MSFSILLLDGNKKFCEKLRQQGFDMHYGTTGYINNVQDLPNHIYEKDIIIYDPKAAQYKINEYRDKTSELSFRALEEYIFKGGVLVIFINKLTDDFKRQKKVYSWLPFTQGISPTKDDQILKRLFDNHDELKSLNSLFLENNIRLPIYYKLKKKNKENFEWENFPNFGSFPVILNNFNETFGLIFKLEKGLVCFLPEFDSNEEVIQSLLYRALPPLFSHNND